MATLIWQRHGASWQQAARPAARLALVAASLGIQSLLRRGGASNQHQQHGKRDPHARSLTRPDLRPRLGLWPLVWQYPIIPRGTRTRPCRHTRYWSSARQFDFRRGIKVGAFLAADMLGPIGSRTDNAPGRGKFTQASAVSVPKGYIQVGLRRVIAECDRLIGVVAAFQHLDEMTADARIDRSRTRGRHILSSRHT